MMKNNQQKLKNVVFDFGQVLVRFDPLYIVSQSISDSEDAKLVTEVAFDRLYWDKLDDGSITEEEITEVIKERLPERLHAPAREVLLFWYQRLPEVPGMKELIGELQNQYGKHVCLLSNISLKFAAHADEIPILETVKDRIFSSVCRMVKPNTEIFEHLCNKFSLVPGETFFIDDNPANIAGAKAFGLGTYLFDGDVQKLKEFLLPLL